MRIRRHCRVMGAPRTNRWRPCKGAAVWRTLPNDAPMSSFAGRNTGCPFTCLSSGRAPVGTRPWRSVTHLHDRRATRDPLRIDAQTRSSAIPACARRQQSPRRAHRVRMKLALRIRHNARASRQLGHAGAPGRSPSSAARAERPRRGAGVGETHRLRAMAQVIPVQPRASWPIPHRCRLNRGFNPGCAGTAPRLLHRRAGRCTHPRRSAIIDGSTS